MDSKLLRTGVAAVLALGTVAAATAPTYAGDGGAIAAGVIGGAALGALAAGAAHAAPPPPPPPYYAPAYYPPPPPPHCWREPRQVWDGYGYVTRPVRVCE